MEEKEIGLYIHMPFCKQKCYYCDFVSYPNRYEMVERYIKCLKSEIVQYANENRIMHEHGLEPKFIIKTIYIGGGTPSSIDELYILNVMETIKANFEYVLNILTISCHLSPSKFPKNTSTVFQINEPKKV